MKCFIENEIIVNDQLHVDHRQSFTKEGKSLIDNGLWRGVRPCVVTLVSLFQGQEYLVSKITPICFLSIIYLFIYLY